MMHRALKIGAVVILVMISGCRRDDQIQTYRVSKDSAGAGAAPTGAVMPTDAPPSPGAPMNEPAMGSEAPPAAAPVASDGSMNTMGNSMGLSAAASANEVAWTVPSGWTAQPPSAMRIGSFAIKGDNGQQAEVSIVPLSGDAGGDLANINRWRGQLNLEPIAEADLSTIARQTTFGGRSMLWVEFASQQKLIQNQFKRRLVAAVYKQGDRSWFFKMMGEDATVQAAEPAFRQFLKSLRFQTSQ